MQMVENIAPMIPNDQFRFRKLNARYIMVNNSSMITADTIGRNSFSLVAMNMDKTSNRTRDTNSTTDLMRIDHLGTSTLSWEALISRKEKMLLLAR